MLRVLILGTAALLTGCEKIGFNDDQLWSEGDPKLAWSKCIFELDKVEAVRGRNLDDLNIGMSNARNQFMMDCMASMNAALLPEHFNDMVHYAKLPTKRQPNDLSLNNGRR